MFQRSTSHKLLAFAHELVLRVAACSYDSGNNLQEDVVPKLAPSCVGWPADGKHLTNDISYDAVVAYLKSGHPVIANVMHGAHFVLVVGYDAVDGDTLYVNDPYFNIQVQVQWVRAWEAVDRSLTELSVFSFVAFADVLPLTGHRRLAHV